MRHIILVTFLFLSCSARGKKQDDTLSLLKSKDMIDTFWKWFVENKATFENITEQNREEKLDLILSQIAKVEKGLAIEISNEFNGVRDIVISAEGDRQKFGVVQEIVSKAPKIEKWTVTAFRQRVNEDFTLKFEDLKFSPSKMFFDPIVDGDSLDVIIFADNIANHDYNQVAYYGLITLDNVLGEYDCVMKVRHYEFRDLSEITNRADLSRVTDLPKYVDNFHNVRQKKP